jgi:hypothetical protein
MKKLFKNLSKWWKAETPKLARFFQVLSAALAALPLYWASLPAEFQTQIPAEYLKYIAIGGGLCVFILQFFNKKEDVK